MGFIVLIAFIFILEYTIKQHMDRVRALGEYRTLAGGKIFLKKYYNTGAAGNFLCKYPKAVRWIHASTLGAAAALLAYLLRRKGAGPWKLGLSFLIGGGSSNLYDRIAKGHVVDYISFGFGPKRFRRLVFDLSDFFILAGVGIIFACSLVMDIDVHRSRYTRVRRKDMIQ